MEVKDHTCSCCGNITRRIHDYRTQIIKEAPIFGKHTYFKYKKRRYVCNLCNKRFYEDAFFAPRYHRDAYMLKEKFYEFVDSPDLESAKKNLKA